MPFSNTASSTAHLLADRISKLASLFASRGVARRRPAAPDRARSKRPLVRRSWAPRFRQRRARLRWRTGLLLPALAAIGVAAPQSAAAFHCKVALVLALDVSSSVDARERRLQAEGLSRAFLDPAVRNAILEPEGSGVMVSVFVWSGVYTQRLTTPWTVIDSDAALEAFALSLRAVERRVWRRPTAVGKALAFAGQLHRDNPIACDRRVVDVSGDGVGNEGVTPAQTRSLGLLDGVTVNALVIRGDTPDPLPYYVGKVISGPGAFALEIQSYEDYADGILRKLLRELTDMFAGRGAELDGFLLAGEGDLSFARN